MRVEESSVLDALVALAAQEAVSAGFAETTTAHLLIALSRMSEEDGPRELSVAASALRSEFGRLGLEPRAFRRRLRGLLGRREPLANSGRISRSRQCKAVFASAQRDSDGAGSPMRPVDLLRAAFSYLGDLGVTGQSNGHGKPGQPLADEIPGEL